MQRSIEHFFPVTSNKRKRDESCNSSSKFSPCPLCQALLPLHSLVYHAADCNGDSDQAITQKAPPNDDLEHVKVSLVSNKILAPIQTDHVPWWKFSAAMIPSLDGPRINEPILPTDEPIPGLHLFHEFISLDEEQCILDELDGKRNPELFLPWKPARFNGQHCGKRWGVHCNLRDRRVGAAENPLPKFFGTILLPKLKRITSMKGCLPNEANAIDYHSANGDYLKDHVDDRQLSKEPIANISIAGNCYMTFIYQKKRIIGPREQLRVLLPRRTLQVLTGSARYDYSHGIRNEDLLDDRRVSVTMRESPLTK
jgi:2OG-Fe(II) oxygenase superfamily